MSRIFANPLEELIEFEEMSRDVERGKGPIQVSGCMDSQKVHMALSLAQDFPYRIILTYSEQKAKEIYQQMKKDLLLSIK